MFGEAKIRCCAKVKHYFQSIEQRDVSEVLARSPALFRTYRADRGRRIVDEVLLRKSDKACTDQSLS